MPIPPPTQSDINAVSLSLRSSSSSAVPSNMAPVAPSGCPMAIAPPLTFTRSTSLIFKSRKNRSTTPAKASFISIRSKSFVVIPAFLSALSDAGPGPTSIIVGSVATKPMETILARGFSPDRRPISSEPTKTAAAPSTIPDEFPAVCKWLILEIIGYFLRATSSKPIFPAFSKAGCKAARSAMVVPGRIFSS